MLLVVRKHIFERNQTLQDLQISRVTWGELWLQFTSWSRCASIELRFGILFEGIGGGRRVRFLVDGSLGRLKCKSDSFDGKTNRIFWKLLQQRVRCIWVARRTGRTVNGWGSKSGKKGGRVDGGGGGGDNMHWRAKRQCGGSKNAFVWEGRQFLSISCANASK